MHAGHDSYSHVFDALLWFVKRQYGSMRYDGGEICIVNL
jgi:hypothetical protein